MLRVPLFELRREKSTEKVLGAVPTSTHKTM